VPVAEFVKLGTKYDGKCVCCERLAGGSDAKRAATMLVKVNGRFAVSHVFCAGGVISGGKYVGWKLFETELPF
jgi:hypothetical protein